MNQKLLTSFHTRNGSVLAALALLFAVGFSVSAALPPKVGDLVSDFTLPSLGGETVQLAKLTASNNVVLVVLRGWPGYQCPVCDRQVHDFIASASQFTAAGAQVVFVYPGPADHLKAHAAEFKSWKGREWPNEFLFVLDPDYSMVNAFGLRWNAPKETAYPSTFVIAKGGAVRFAKISHGHGDRAKAADVLAEVKKLVAK